MIRRLNLFYTTCGSITDAEDLAKKMISDNFASCINIIKDVKSFYKEKTLMKLSTLVCSNKRNTGLLTILFSNILMGLKAHGLQLTAQLISS